MTKLTIKNCYNKISITDYRDDLGIDDMVQLFKEALLACGYQSDSIYKAFDEQ